MEDIVYSRSRAPKGNLENLVKYTVRDVAHKFAQSKIWFLQSAGYNKSEYKSKYDKWYKMAEDALNNNKVLVLHGNLFSKDSDLLKKEIEWKGYDKYLMDGVPLEVIK